MKTTYKFILVALAATAALTACTKDLTTGKVDGNQPEGTLRTIAVSFSTPTKSYISGYNESDKEYNVQFSEGDKILVSDGKTTEECEVIPKPGVLATTNPQMVIQTKLKGSLVAVYPSDAAKVENDQITGIIVDDMQSGSFADANICTADQGGAMAKSNDALTFTTRVAILRFYADQSIGVSKIQINSEGPNICTEGTTIIIDTAYEKPQSDQKEQAKKKAAAAAPTSRFLYAAVDVSSPVTATALTIRSYAESQGEGYVEKTPTANVDLVYNKMYNVFIPYYIKVQVGTDEGDNPIYQKWGYCNIGAFLPEEPGLYFAWGDTQGYKWDAENEQFEGGHSFTWANCPHTDGTYTDEAPNVFTKYTANDASYAVSGIADGKTVLDAEDDAAAAKWGGKWRMPTKEECSILLNQTSTTLDNVIENKGLVINNTSLLFPFTGSGVNTGLMFPDGMGCVLTSSLFEESSKEAYGLMFWPSRPYLGVDESSRYIGYPIRPIYDESITDEQPTALTINPYPNGGTF